MKYTLVYILAEIRFQEVDVFFFVFFFLFFFFGGGGGAVTCPTGSTVNCYVMDP